MCSPNWHVLYFVDQTGLQLMGSPPVCAQEVLRLQTCAVVLSHGWIVLGVGGWAGGRAQKLRVLCCFYRGVWFPANMAAPNQLSLQGIRTLFCPSRAKHSHMKVNKETCYSI